MQDLCGDPGNSGSREMKPIRIKAVIPDVIYTTGDDFPGSSEVCTCALNGHRMCTFEVHTIKSEDDGYFIDPSEINRDYLLMDFNVYRNGGAQKRYASSSLSHRSCSFEKSAHIDAKACEIYSNGVYGHQGSPFMCTVKVHVYLMNCTRFLREDL
jgi:hypothetical protein